MAGRAELAVWLYGSQVATLAEGKAGKLRFGYRPEAETAFRRGSPIFSASMPIDPKKRPREDAVRAFFCGLLPEGVARVPLAGGFDVAADDDFGLLSAIGRDCAGAVVLQPPDQPPPGCAGAVDLLTDEALHSLVAHLRRRPLGDGEEVRVTLAGTQEKLPLAQTEKGEWARPVEGTPSTHILKPQDMRLASYAASEAFCLEIARQVGITDVTSEVVHLAGRPVLVVSRYDRVRTPDGVEHIHQEDTCQALGVDCSANPLRKYQMHGGPSLRDLALLVATLCPSADRSKLLALTVVNVLVGNADAHAKNISILHFADGRTRLAPAYDITPTSYYKNIPTKHGPRDLSSDLAMSVNQKRSVHEVTLVDLIAEGVSWGIHVIDATRVVDETLQKAFAAIPAAAEMSGVPTQMVDFVVSRARSLAAAHRAGGFPAPS